MLDKFFIVTKDAYLRNIKSFSFISMVISPIIVMGIILGFSYFLNRDMGNNQEIAIISDDPNIVNYFEESSSKIKINDKINTLEEAKDGVIQKKINGYLVVNGDKSTSTQYITKKVNDPIYDEIKVKMLEYQFLKANGVQNTVPAITKKLIKIKNRRIL